MPYVFKQPGANFDFPDMKLYSIQFLRAFAAILVVHCHTMDVQIKHFVSAQQDFYFLQNFGAIGVDIFFIISGVIISIIGADLKGKKDAGSFIVKRFLRINPLYYLVSVFAFILLFIQNDLHFSYKWIVRTILVQPFGIPLAVGWTLAFEWMFYMLFALLIFLKQLHKQLLVCLMITIITFIGWLVYHTTGHSITLANPIILEFAAGSLLGLLFKSMVKVPPFLAAGSLLIGLMGYLLLIRFGYGEASEVSEILYGNYSFKRLIYFGLPSICLVFGCLNLENVVGVHKFWKIRWFQMLGDASYSIYLTHTIIFALLDLWYDRINLTMPGDLVMVLQIALAIAIGVAFHKTIELPLLRKFAELRARYLFS